MAMGPIDSQEPVYRAEHEIDVLDKRIADLEQLVLDMYAELNHMRDDVFLMGYIEKRMKELGIEV